MRQRHLWILYSNEPQFEEILIAGTTLSSTEFKANIFRIPSARPKTGIYIVYTRTDIASLSLSSMMIDDDRRFDNSRNISIASIKPSRARAIPTYLHLKIILICNSSPKRALHSLLVTHSRTHERIGKQRTRIISMVFNACEKHVNHDPSHNACIAFHQMHPMQRHEALWYAMQSMWMRSVVRARLLCTSFIFGCAAPWSFRLCLWWFLTLFVCSHRCLAHSTRVGELVSITWWSATTIWKMKRANANDGTGWMLEIVERKPFFQFFVLFLVNFFQCLSFLFIRLFQLLLLVCFDDAKDQIRTKNWMK